MALKARSFDDPRWSLSIASLALIAVACAWLGTAAGRRWTAMLTLSLAPTVCFLALWLTPPVALATAVDAIRLVGPLAVVAMIGTVAMSRLRRRRRSTS